MALPFSVTLCVLGLIVQVWVSNVQSSIQLRSSRMFQLTAAVDVQFSDRLLFCARTDHELQCFALCLQTLACHGVTVTSPLLRATSSVTCRGHRKLPAGSPTVPSPSTRYFESNVSCLSTSVVSWLYLTCSLTTECEEFSCHGVCYTGQCVCAVGYYYSVTLNGCVTDCTKSDQQGSYVSYQGLDFKEFDISSPTLSSLAACQSSCATHPGCRSAVYSTSRSKCYHKNATAVPYLALSSCSTCTYLHPLCA